MRSLPDPGFAGDDGAADPGLTAALREYDARPTDADAWNATLAALQDARVLVPVLATATGVTDTGAEKDTEMAAVLMQSRSGRTALLAFTGLDALRTWDPAARPVPVSSRDAARAALQDGAEALLVDVAGPVLLAVEGEDLRSLAAGHRLVRLEAGWGWLTQA